MASTAARRLRELQAQTGNKTCVDCAQRNPQWASVSYGVFMCLECSGKHRDLGVHISFVRSVTMDSWTEAQLRKMEAGGNDRLNVFLTAHGVPKETPHVAKYNSNAAAAYRDRIAALAEGKPWTDPPVVKESPGSGAPAAARKPLVHTSAASGGGGGGGGGGWETVCEGADAERSAASCVTYVGVELRQRSVSVGARVLASSADDGSSSCGSSMRESAAAAAAAVADVAAMAWRPDANGGMMMKKRLEEETSLDWEKYMKDNSNILGEVSALTIHHSDISLGNYMVAVH